MFTGLIQKVGKLDEFRSSPAARRITVSCEPWDSPLDPGESVAVQGVCLTVAEILAGGFSCDVLAETERSTAFKMMKKGRLLNLERALKASDRLGGHFVQGHVDGTGIVESMERHGADTVAGISCDSSLLESVVLKGSVALDGVSLTVASVNTNGFAVHLIPTTMSGTSLRQLRRGEAVNIETDILAKYVRQFAGTAVSSGVTLEKLREAGFSA